MIKKPLPTFTAAYPTPKADYSYLIIAIIIAGLIGLYFYVDYQIKQGDNKTLANNPTPTPKEPTEESIKDLPSGSTFSASNSCPIGSTALSSGFTGGFMCVKN